MPKDAKQLAAEVREIWDRADREGRDLTLNERHFVEDLVSKAESQGRTDRQIKSAGMDEFFASFWGNGDGSGGGPGDRFVKSEGYKQIKDSSARGQSWTSGAVDVGTFELLTKGTMFEGGGGTLVPPDYRAGVVDKLFTPIGLADYFKSSQTTSTQVRYAVEGTAASAATGVAEGGTKPESTLAYNETVEQVRKIATVLPISDELLEDAVSIQTYINSQADAVSQARGGAPDSPRLRRRLEPTQRHHRRQRREHHERRHSERDKIFRAAAGVRGSAFVDPDLLCIHPDNWVTSRLAQDAAGQYYGGGPWSGQYGAGPNQSASSFSSAPYWGLRVWVTPLVGAGTALVGNASQAAELIRRGGVSIETTNSHSDFFVKDLSMIRAEERLALALYRPAAWVEVRGLT